LASLKLYLLQLTEADHYIDKEWE